LLLQGVQGRQGAAGWRSVETVQAEQEPAGSTDSVAARGRPGATDTGVAAVADEYRVAARAAGSTHMTTGPARTAGAAGAAAADQHAAFAAEPAGASVAPREAGYRRDGVTSGAACPTDASVGEQPTGIAAIAAGASGAEHAGSARSTDTAVREEQAGTAAVPTCSTGSLIVKAARSARAAGAEQPPCVAANPASSATDSTDSAGSARAGE
jgi:syndecan 1